MISFDTEDTSVDFYHGARPFFLTTCTDKGVVRFWEWDVDPLTRTPRIPEGDLREFGEYLFADGPHGPIGDWEDGGGLVGHNLKFDFTAMASVGLWDGWDVDSAWASVHDTLVAGHLLFSNRPHDLTSMVMQYLGHDILPLEERLKEAVQKARNVARSHLPDWRIARDGLEEMPSARGEVWRADYWLPRAVCREARRLYSAWVKTPKQPEPEPEGVARKVRRRKPQPDPWFVEYARRGHPWETVLRDYANADSECTLLLWQAVRGQLRRRGLWEIYLERLKVLPVTYHMERRGITVNGAHVEEMKRRAREESEQNGLKCVNVARSMGTSIVLPKSGNNQSIRNFCFGPLNLPAIKRSEKTGEPALDKHCLEVYEATLDKTSKAYHFVRSLRGKRARDTAQTYLQGYERFMLPLPGGEDGVPVADWFVLHPSINPTGTDTLRWSFSNPNSANVSKKEDFSLRYCFGPAPGREWWSLDYENIELRIPAYESGEEEMIQLFEHPDDPPYYGSQHLLYFDLLHPEKFKQHGKDVKKVYASSWYQWTKNGNFACVPMDTQILTRTGWKTYEDVVPGDETLGYEDGVLRWTPVLEKVKFLDAELVELRNKQFRAVTTPDHRWVGRKRRASGKGASARRWYEERTFSSEELTTCHEIYLSAPTDDVGVLDITPDEAAIIGFSYSDGSVIRSTKGWGPARGGDGLKVGFQVRLYQSKPRGVEYIGNLLERWGKGYKEYDYNRPGGMKLWILNPGACRDIWKRAGLWDAEDFSDFVLKLGTEQREAFLDAVWQAEGNLDRRGHKLISQNAGGFADAIELAIFMCGRYCTVYDKKSYYPTKHQCKTYRYAVPRVTGQRIKKTPAGRADVWCVRTGLGSWVMRQNGRIMLTGNCQYGAQREKADATYKVPGAFDKIKSRFRRLSDLNERYVQMANRFGYVETMPDRTVNPNRGYPLMCARTEYGKILPTVPLSYHVQSTAMWCTFKAMLRCDEYLRELTRADPRGYYMVLQVHDEIVFDFPAGGKDNLPKIRHVQKLMERSGEDIGVPLRTSVTYNPNNWAESGEV